MTHFSAPEELANHLMGRKCEKTIWLVGIDGKDGVGKSELAERLSELLDVKLVSLDRYLEQHRDRYVAYLKVNELADEIREVRGLVIIEGVCLLAAAERMGMQLNELVYVKRMRHGLWVDEEICSPDRPVDEVLEKEKSDLFVFLEWEASVAGKALPSEDDAQLSPLTEEIIRYHAKYQPSRVASHIFEANHA